MLLETARAVLEDTTVAKLTMQDVARRARVHAALIHYYFRSKRGLLVALVEDFVTRLEQDLSARGAASHLADALLAVIDVYAGLVMQERYVSAVAIESIVQPAERDAHPGRAVMEVLASHVERALAGRGEQEGSAIAADSRAITAHLVLDASLVCRDAELPDDVRHSALARAVDRLLHGLLGRRPSDASPA